MVRGARQQNPHRSHHSSTPRNRTANTQQSIVMHQQPKKMHNPKPNQPEASQTHNPSASTSSAEFSASLKASPAVQLAALQELEQQFGDQWLKVDRQLQEIKKNGGNYTGLEECLRRVQLKDLRDVR